MNTYEVELCKSIKGHNHRVEFSVRAWNSEAAEEYANDFYIVNGWTIVSVERQWSL